MVWVQASALVPVWVLARGLARGLAQGRGPEQALAREQELVVAWALEAGAECGSGEDRYCCPYGNRWHRCRPSGQGPERGQG